MSNLHYLVWLIPPPFLSPNLELGGAAVPRGGSAGRALPAKPPPLPGAERGRAPLNPPPAGQYQRTGNYRATGTGMLSCTSHRPRLCPHTAGRRQTDRQTDRQTSEPGTTPRPHLARRAATTFGCHRQHRRVFCSVTFLFTLQHPDLLLSTREHSLC